MLRIARSSTVASVRNNVQTVSSRRKQPRRLHRRDLASNSNSNSNSVKNELLAADTGALGTSVYHSLSTFLTIGTPLYMLSPPSLTEGVVDTSLSLLLSVGIGVHSWIGLNYVAADYAPKISKSLLGPSRFLCAGMGIVTVLGLGKISLESDGGVKGLVRKGLWGGKQKTTEEK